MNDKKILVCAPQHISKMYAWSAYSNVLRNLTYENVEFFFSDNSDTEDNSNFIKSQGFNCEHLKPKKGESLFSKITQSHEACRAYFLKGDYDYMLHLETDVIPPIDIIERLLQKELPVVSAMYDIGVGFERYGMIHGLAKHETLNIKGYKSVDYLKESEVIEVNGFTTKVLGCGLGCVLIRRDIVSMVKFRNDDKILASADTFWSMDLYANSVPLYLATDIYCKHMNEDWSSKITVA